MSTKKAFLLPRLGKGEIPSYFLEIQEDIRDLMVPRPGKFFLALAVNWLIILSAIGFWLYLENYWLLPLAIVIIGARQHALAILMHEGAHGNIHRNRRWNNRIAKWFIAWPIGVNFDNYKYVHMRHHLHLNEDKDPDWMIFSEWGWDNLPKSKMYFLKFFGRFLLGYGFVDMLRYQDKWYQVNPNSSRLNGDLLPVLAFIALAIYGAVTAEWSFLLFYFLLWITPLAMVAYPVNLFRAMIEHYGFPNHKPEDKVDRLKNSRTVRGNIVEQFFFIPYNVGRHLEHHIYDTVPFYNLEKLSAILQRNQKYLETAPLFATYFGEKGASKQIVEKTG